MATQFYKTVEDILKLKQENQQVTDKLVQYNQVDESFDSELATLRANLKGLGVSNEQSQDSIEAKFIDKSKRIEFIKEHNIKPGSERWFKVMYAQPELTGEDPFGDNNE